MKSGADPVDAAALLVFAIGFGAAIAQVSVLASAIALMILGLVVGAGRML